jgi:hypothetical protein
MVDPDSRREKLPGQSATESSEDGLRPQVSRVIRKPIRVGSHHYGRKIPSG